MTHTILPDDNFMSTVRPVASGALEECERILPPVSEYRVVVQYTDGEFVKEKMGGSTGMTGDGRGMTLEVNTDTAGWEAAVRSTVAHEYNHVVRFQSTGDTYETLTVRDNFAVEGLALCFEEEFTGITPPYATALSEEAAWSEWEKVKQYLDKPAHEWSAHIWIADNDEFPLWTGYTLSYVMVKRRLSKLDMGWPELIRQSTDMLIGTFRGVHL